MLLIFVLTFCCQFLLYFLLWHNCDYTWRAVVHLYSQEQTTNVGWFCLLDHLSHLPADLHTPGRQCLMDIYQGYKFKRDKTSLGNSLHHNAFWVAKHWKLMLSSSSSPQVYSQTLGLIVLPNCLCIPGIGFVNYQVNYLVYMWKFTKPVSEPSSLIMIALGPSAETPKFLAICSQQFISKVFLIIYTGHVWLNISFLFIFIFLF